MASLSWKERTPTVTDEYGRPERRASRARSYSQPHGDSHQRGGTEHNFDRTRFRRASGLSPSPNRVTYERERIMYRESSFVRVQEHESDRTRGRSRTRRRRSSSYANFVREAQRTRSPRGSRRNESDAELRDRFANLSLGDKEDERYSRGWRRGMGRHTQRVDRIYEIKD